jgi:HSP20 family protein
MKENFWKRLPRPIFSLAPMEDVSDTSFRQLVMEISDPVFFHVIFTEFTSTDGLCHPVGRKNVISRLLVNDTEREVLKNNKSLTIIERNKIMTMMRWNPDTPLSDLFENFFRSHSNERMERKHYDCSPSTNILEKDDSFELHMAVPGVKKEDVKIDLEKNVLSISSEKKAEKTEEVEGKYSRREFLYGTFCRSFTLPETINVDKIKADLKDGILKVILPKKEETRITKEIKIA